MRGTDADVLLVVMARAGEAGVSRPLFDDPFAQVFVDAAVARGWQLPDDAMAERVRALTGYAASRTKWFDEFFLAAGAYGVEQSVILGAGLDARAWRMPWVSTSVVYEIDRPEVLEFKLETLRAHGAEPATTYVPVPVDLRQDWPKALRVAGFDASEPAAWSAEGLLPHLPAEGQDRLLALIHEISVPSSRIAVEATGAGVTEGRTDIAGWLAGLGWAVTSIDSRGLMDRYHRCSAGHARDALPDTVFVNARLESATMSRPTAAAIA